MIDNGLAPPNSSFASTIEESWNGTTVMFQINSIHLLDNFIDNIFKY